MIDQNKVTNAIKEFTSNPDWKDVFTNAPAGAMERLAISFYFSKEHENFKPEDFDEYRNLREEIEQSLSEEDLQYLITATDKKNTIQHYEQLLERLQNKGGEPTGKLKFDFTEEVQDNGGGETVETEAQVEQNGENPPQEEAPKEDQENVPQ